MITIDDFLKVEIKVGQVLEAVEVENSDKLIKLTVDLGEDQPRTVLTGMREWKTPEDFKDKQLVFVTNLEPRQMMGIESAGMVMAADSDDGPALLLVERSVPPGTKVR